MTIFDAVCDSVGAGVKGPTAAEVSSVIVENELDDIDDASLVDIDVNEVVDVDEDGTVVADNTFVVFVIGKSVDDTVVEAVVVVSILQPLLQLSSSQH